MIHLISAFRNAEHRLTHYLAQAYALRYVTGFKLTVTATVGDSVDKTEQELRRVARGEGEGWFTVHRFDHGELEYGSTEHPNRLNALSRLLNDGLETVVTRSDVADRDTVIWLEGDLFWDAYSIIQLHRFLQRAEVDVVAPMVMAGEAFYDTWGFRTIDGRRWGPFWPWGLIEDFTQPSALVEMGTVGSCVAMTVPVAKMVRVHDNLALAGWCLDARRRGYRIWCAKDVRIQHPFDWRT